MPVSKRSTTISVIEPYWKSECGLVTIYLGDCREVLPRLQAEQFHAVVTDPPYELKFMNKGWDGSGVAYDVRTWEAVLRVALPGAHLLSFGGSRTYHRMACAIEDAEWEIRDCVMWLYFNGYPKSMDIGKAIDKKLGAKRQQIRTPMSPNSNVMMDKIGATRPWKEAAKVAGYHEHDDDEPVTEAAKEWHGWGTTLKPAYEPVVLARKALSGTAAECVMEHGAGGLNIDACRVGTTGQDVTRVIESKESSGSGVYNFNRANQGSESMSGGFTKTQKDGRWPANLIHDGSDEVVGMFPQVSSSRGTSALPKKPGDSLGEDHGNSDHEPTTRGYDDDGSAARFFYSPKADDSDRPHGKGAVVHPTVKPLDLMRYLVRLTCVRGGRVLDPFMGSGSTLCAAVLEGMYCVGVELSQEYADIAIGKIKLALESAPDTSPHVNSSTKSKPIPQVRREAKKLRGS